MGDSGTRTLDGNDNRLHASLINVASGFDGWYPSSVTGTGTIDGGEYFSVIACFPVEPWVWRKLPIR